MPIKMGKLIRMMQHTDSGELLALAEAGVGSISTGYNASSLADVQGNEDRQVGTAATATDVCLKMDAMNIKIIDRGI